MREKKERKRERGGWKYENTKNNYLCIRFSTKYRKAFIFVLKKGMKLNSFYKRGGFKTTPSLPPHLPKIINATT